MSTSNADDPGRSRDADADGSRLRYTLRPVRTPVTAQVTTTDVACVRGTCHLTRPPDTRDPFARPANEDDDGYDPFSDRPPAPEPTFEEDPWR